MFRSIRLLARAVRPVATCVRVFLVLCVSVPLSAQTIIGVTDVKIVARLTGAASMNATDEVGIGGTDLGHMVNHNGCTYFLFGDTFSGETPSIGGNWRSNVMAYTTDGVPSDGISFDGWITDNTGMAREVIASGRTTNPPTITEIPTGAISIGNRIYAWYMAVDWWGPAGQWNANYAGLAYWQEGDEMFTVVDDFEFPGDGNFGMVAASFRTDPGGVNDDHLYIWGTPAGRLGGVKLARVFPDQVTDLGAYEYFAGMVGNEPTWLTNELAVDTIIDPTVGEMSVMYNEAAGSWTMLYFNHAAYAIELREAPEPWGPWSDPIPVLTGQKAPGLYGSYMNPLYVENDGETIYFTMSLWNPYDVFLVKATLSIVPKPTMFIFYNNSSWDDRQGAADDDAIAPDKVALRPGIKATLANYTSYDKGINGLMIDVYGLPGTPSVDDFLFRKGNDDHPYGHDLSIPEDDWPWAPDPTTVAMRPGAGQDGADRVTLIWEDGAIRNCWLQVTMLATDATGLAENQVFYVGNAVGESGNSTADALVNATDEIGTRNNPHSPFSPAPKDDHYDFNRDKLVNATDQIIARNNRTSPFTVLKLITPPLESVGDGGEGE